MSLMGRSTCASASALSLDAQPAQAERVVRRISRPVCGIGIFLQKKTSNQFFWSLVNSISSSIITALSLVVLVLAAWSQGTSWYLVKAK